MDRTNTPQPIDSVETAELAETDSKRTRDVLKIASLSIALGLGFAAASLQSLERTAAGFNFHVTFWTLVAFIGGAGLGLLFWRICTQSPEAARRHSVWFLLVGVAMFLYPLRFIPSERKLEMVEGLILAVCALSGVGFMLYQVIRYLDSDTTAFTAKGISPSQTTKISSPADSVPGKSRPIK